MIINLKYFYLSRLDKLHTLHHDSYNRSFFCKKKVTSATVR